MQACMPLLTWLPRARMSGFTIIATGPALSATVTVMALPDLQAG